MMTSASILSTCPCCETSLVIDLSTGDVSAETETATPTQESRISGISVVHATPEYYQYRDPTHLPRQPMLQPITHPVAAPLDEEELPSEEASPDLIHRTNSAHFQDLKNRYLL
jgi:hypothetical protein